MQRGQGDSNTPVGSPFVKGAGGLNNPASYTFTASITDYESRFKLVFVANENDNENENTPFAFIHNGNIIVNGEGTLQIVDVLGRVLFSQENATVNYQLSTVNYASGVYVLRLINGDDVKTQKIVVR